VATKAASRAKYELLLPEREPGWSVVGEVSSMDCEEVSPILSIETPVAKETKWFHG
jgi:hypothetical protein